MHILNNFFTPFALILATFAIYFSALEKDIIYKTVAVIIIQFSLSYYFSKNIYKFMRHMQMVRISLVIFNMLATSIIFYYLSAYWAPIWLLFVIPPAAAAMFLKRTGTAIISVLSAFCMLGVYQFKSILLESPLSEQLWGMAASHAVFIVVFSMFLNSMSEMMIKMRSSR